MKKTLLLIWRCDRRRFLLKLLYTAVASLLPLANLYVLKMLVDTVMQCVGDGFGVLGESLIFYILLFCGITLLVRLTGVLNTVNSDVLTQKLVDYINGLIQDQSIALDMSYYDNPEYHDTFHRAQQEAAYRPIRIMESMMAVFGSVLSLAGIVVMLLSVSWEIIVVMIVAILPTFVVRLYKSRRIYRFRRETTQLQRRSNYFGSLLTNRVYAKEVRAYGLAGFFRKSYMNIRRTMVNKLMKISRRMAFLDATTAIVEACALAAVMFLLIRPVAEGILTIGTFVMLFEAFRRGQGYLGSLVGGVSGVYEHKLFIYNLFEFLELKPLIKSPEEPVVFPEIIEEVSFNDITFSYPDMKQPVLSHYSLKAARGEITYIEGENGFGKTTLLKLLLRLYDPQQGSVCINGIDIRRFDVAELRHGISAIFQDYVNYCFTVRDTVALGDIGRDVDECRIAEAIRMADDERVVQRLGKGLDTMLGRQFEGGEDLSMGQWQRIALARQLYSNAQVLLFDEPMAWMDAEACKQFMHTLEELRQNHVVILVRHIEHAV